MHVQQIKYKNRFAARYCTVKKLGEYVNYCLYRKTHILENQFQSILIFLIESDFEILICLPHIKLAGSLLVLLIKLKISQFRMHKNYTRKIYKKDKCTSLINK